MPRLTLVVPALLVVVATAAPALASPADHWALEGGFGVRVGSVQVDGADLGTVVPLHLDLGVRHDRLRLFADYQFANVTFPNAGGAVATVGGDASRAPASATNGSGFAQRLGATARWSIGRVGEADGGMDAFVEAGLGAEHYAWDAGGAWTRPDVELGFGGMLWGGDSHSHGGVSVGVRVVLAPREPAATGPIACGGPCDEPTAPTRIDRSIMFDATMLFGR